MGSFQVCIHSNEMNLFEGQWRNDADVLCGDWIWIRYRDFADFTKVYSQNEQLDSLVVVVNGLKGLHASYQLNCSFVGSFTPARGKI